MALLRGLFAYLVPGADPTSQRVVREDALTRITLVPVPSAEAAAAVAAELLASEGLDLIELYGGLGPKAAAKVLAVTGDGAVPVGLVGVEYPAPEGNIAAVFAASGADSATDRWVFEHEAGRVTVVVVPSTADVAPVARELVAEGVERIEVCGGMGPVPATEVMAATGDRVPVSAVLYGFESLPAVAAYRARFEAAARGLAG
ncbi:DUF6506 family protein [Saccharothrix coeruleofusca]|uniref:Uncharacterized protein n=1 Tax=Saccharothrix coeruleofusca TaxID=33919 RepID=A0A918AQ45_9PSEU|nr:DUF6506 family protein [Saccharothrix coeruleofusca]MBP2334942.1 hypothetical protein [Saccharothrix coeruleofusca]GGP68089.1 hypothetical protein GCM10010185_46100 [Saccharothrix coeruleofusca]